MASWCVQRWVAAIVLLGAACGGAVSGTLTALPPERASSAELTTSDVGGLRVLWNGTARGPIDADEGWAAGSQAELEDLWESAGLRVPTPRLDFTREVVFGMSGPGGACPIEITGARLEPGGVLRLVHAPLGGFSCVDVQTRVAVIVAVPRAAVGRAVTLAPTPSHRGVRLRVPPAADGGAPAVERRVGASPSQIGAPGAMPAMGSTSHSALGDVALPERGHLALARVADGSEVWIVHHRDGQIDVLCSAVAARDTNFFDLQIPIASALRVTPAWDARRGRFYGGYDAHGRNVHGWPPLCRHRFTRVGPRRIRIEGATAIDTAPIQPSTQAPVLDGLAAPYRERRALERFEQIPLGHVELLATDVVWGRSGPARLCRAPGSDSVLSQFTGCADEAPRVASSLSDTRSGVLVVEGPVVVRRLGAALAEVVLHERFVVRAVTWER